MKASKPYEVVENLREWRIGALERLPWTDPLLGKPISEWPVPEGGETVEVFKQRVRSALTFCLKQSERPLLVSHGAFCRILLDLLNIPDQHVPNCTLYKFASSCVNNEVLWTLDEY